MLILMLINSTKICLQKKNKKKNLNQRFETCRKVLNRQKTQSEKNLIHLILSTQFYLSCKIRILTISYF